jgi:hypothetical protein
MHPHGIFGTGSLKNVLTEFYCIFNIISLYTSLQFYRMAIKVFVTFQAAFNTCPADETGCHCPFPGGKVARAVKLTTPLVSRSTIH